MMISERLLYEHVLIMGAPYATSVQKVDELGDPVESGNLSFSRNSFSYFV